MVATPLAAAPASQGDAPEQGSVRGLDATLIAELPEGTFGPYVGTARDGRSLAVWAAPTEQGDRRWFSVVLDARGAPMGEPRELAPAPGQLALATIRALPQGYLALATHTEGDGTRLEASLLGRSGELASGPIGVAQSRGEVLWVQALAVAGRPVAVWAALADGAAEIHMAAIDASKGSAQPTPVVEHVQAWQAVELGDGLAVVTISAAAAAGRALRVTYIDADGRTLAQAEVRRGPGLGSQLDAARIGERLVVSWVERLGLEDRVHVAAIGSDARVEQAPAPIAPFGEQRLIQIVPPAGPRGDGFLVWENVGQAPRGERALSIARWLETGVGADRAELTFIGAAHERPELWARGAGIAALTRAPVCARSAETCSGSVQSAFVELGADNAVIASEPLQLAVKGTPVADLGWGLGCGPDACTALAALTESPVPVYGVELRSRSDGWRALARAPEHTAPRARGMEAVSETEPLADVAAAPVGDRVLVATLSQFDESTPYVRRTTPAPDGRFAPLRARLAMQAFDAGGARAAAAQVVSYRARSTGGIALASAPGERALLAWTALDKQRSEVFATLLGRSGQALAQRMLTLGAGDVSAVDAGALPLGFVVGWISERGGEPQLTLARLNSDLSRSGPERQLSQPPGAARALSLLVSGERVWLAWVQANDREQTLWLTRLEPRTLARLGDDVPLRRTSDVILRSTELVARGDGALAAWIEQPKIAGAEASRVRLVEVSADGSARGQTKTVGSSLEDPTAVRLFCAAEDCQGVIDSRPPSEYVLEGFDWRAESPSGDTRRLVYRRCAAADPPALAIAGSHVFYADRDRQRGLLRHLEVAWR